MVVTVKQEGGEEENVAGGAWAGFSRYLVQDSGGRNYCHASAAAAAIAAAAAVVWQCWVIGPDLTERV